MNKPTKAKRIILLIIVTIIWVFIGAGVFKGSTDNIPFWMWLILGIAWWLVIEFTKTKRENMDK